MCSSNLSALPVLSALTILTIFATPTTLTILAMRTTLTYSHYLRTLTISSSDGSEDRGRTRRKRVVRRIARLVRVVRIVRVARAIRIARIVRALRTVRAERLEEPIHAIMLSLIFWPIIQQRIISNYILHIITCYMLLSLQYVYLHVDNAKAHPEFMLHIFFSS